MKKVKDYEVSLHFGSKIKELRKQKGLSLAELENRTGLSATYLNRIELSLRRTPSIFVVALLAIGLEESVDTLVNWALEDFDGVRRGQAPFQLPTGEDLI